MMRIWHKNGRTNVKYSGSDRQALADCASITLAMYKLLLRIGPDMEDKYLEAMREILSDPQGAVERYTM